MSIITEDFENPYTKLLQVRYPAALAQSALDGENPYHRKLQELCSIPNPYRREEACNPGSGSKDEYFPPNPYRSEDKRLLPRPRQKRSQVFDIPNPYR